MLQSMTGFGTKTFILTGPSGEKSNVSMSLKSLNNRFFDTTCRFPYVLSHLETKLIALLKKQLIRGHLYLTIHMSNSDLFRGAITPALTTVDAYADAIEQIRKRLLIKSPVTLENILRLPNIFNAKEQTIDQQTEEKLFQSVEDLIQQVLEARMQEGKYLAKDITARIEIIQHEIEIIEKQSLTAMKAQKQKVSAALKGIGTDDSSLAEAHKTALYSVLDKIDIHEEIIRFKSHLQNLNGHLSSSVIEKGKKLDFTLQELTREINTIAAKCSDATIGTHAINIKVEIEKSREQVQNVV